jgi:hypothetical protein
MTRDRLIVIAAWVSALSPHDRRVYESLLTKRKRGRPSDGKPTPHAREKEQARDYYRALAKQPGMTAGAAMRQTIETFLHLDRNVVERACGVRHGKSPFYSR